MRIEFTNQPPNDSLLITAESCDEAVALSRWDNCVLSAKYDYETGEHGNVSKLLIVKEI